MPARRTIRTQLFGNSQAVVRDRRERQRDPGSTQYFLSGLSKYDNGIMLNTGTTSSRSASNVTQQFRRTSP